MNKFKKLLLASSILVAAGAANAGYTVNTSDTDAVSFGGYIKIDVRNVNGDVEQRDYFLGGGGATDATESKSQTRLNASESRFNMKYVHGDVMGFIELDFFGGGGSQTISNSSNPRLRHAFIKYDKFVVGQTWSTFMNTSALAETLDFAGPVMGAVFARQPQVRYTNGALQVSIENPESNGGDTTQDAIPDLVAKYTFKGDWGSVSTAALVRELNTNAGDSETAVGYSLAGRIKTGGKNDLRFQYHGGEVGRYVGALSGKDLVNEKVQETTSYLVAYRHFWTEDTRSTIAYGHAKADISKLESTQWSVNLIKNLTKQLSVGIEVGNFSDDLNNIDSNYTQASLKYVL